MSSESTGSVTANQIFTLLGEFFNSFNVSGNRTLDEMLTKESDVLFEFLEHAVDAFPQIFFEKCGNDTQVTLLEYSILKLLEISQYLLQISIRVKLCSTISYMFKMYRCSCYKIYLSFSNTLFNLSSHIHSSLAQNFESCQFECCVSISFENKKNTKRVQETLHALLSKLLCRDRSLLLRRADVAWLISTSLIQTDYFSENSISLITQCFLAGIIPVKKQVSEFFMHLTELIHSFTFQLTHPNFLKKITKFFNVFKTLPNIEFLFYIISNLVFLIKKQNFWKLTCLEYQTCLLIEQCNFTCAEESFVREIQKSLLFSDAPPTIIKYFHNSENYFCSRFFDFIHNHSNIESKIQNFLDEISTVSSVSEKICILKLTYICYREIGLDFSDKILKKFMTKTCQIISSELDYFDSVSALFLFSKFSDLSDSNILFIKNSLSKHPLILNDNVVISSLLKNSSLNFRSLIISSIFYQLKSTSNTMLLQPLSELIPTENERLLIVTILSELDDVYIICQCLLNLKTWPISPEVVNRLLAQPLLQFEDIIATIYFKLFTSTIIYNKFKENISTYLINFISIPFTSLISFNLQNRFALGIAKIAELFCHLDTNLSETALSRIIEFSLVFSNAFIQILSNSFLKVLKLKNLSLMDFYHLNSELVNRPFLNVLTSTTSDDLRSKIILMISNLRLLFEYNGQMLITYLITEIIKLAVCSQSTQLIEIIASLKNCSIQELVLNHSKYIFPDVFIKCSKKEFDNFLRFIQKLMSVPLSNVIKSEFQPIVNHSLLYLHEHESSIVTGILGMMDKNPFSKSYEYKPGSLDDLFQSRLLGVLAFFNFSLLSGDLCHKKSVIKCVGSLIKISGTPAVDRFRLKLLALLKFITEVSLKYELYDYALQAWASFIDILSEKYLGPFLAQIVLSVLPLIQNNQDSVYNVLNKLLIENARSTHDNLKEIHIFSDIPRFKMLKQVVSNYWTKNILNVEFDVCLNEFLRGLTNDQAEIRKTAMINFSDFIAQRWLLSGRSIFDKCNKGILLQILNQLLRCCSDQNPDAIVEVGRCLGAIGCLDYSQFAAFDQPQSTVHFSLKLPTKITNNLDQFCIILLNNLAIAFQAVSETRHQDCAAYAIQEIMQLYNFSNPLFRENFLKCFSESVQEVLIPHLNSSYSSSPPPLIPRPVQPILGTCQYLSYNAWLKHWCSSLISLLPSQGFTSSLLKPCYAITHYYSPIAKMLLPYVIILLFEQDPSLITEILTEINHVFNLSDSLKISDDCKIKAIGTIFEILDFLNDYKTSCDESLNLSIQNFLSSFCQKQLCLSSIACRSFARALRYLEQFISLSSNSSAVLVDNLDLLIKIYYSLNDYDGIIGSSRIYPSIQLDSSIVLQLFIEGRFCEALACLEKRDDDNKCQLETLKCHLSLGQFRSMLTYLNAQKYTNEPCLQDLRAEALWRLESWSELDQISTQNSQNSAGFVFLHLYKNDKQKVNEALRASYLDEVQKLCVLDTEPNVLKRCAPHLARLHLLFDLEMFSRCTLGNNFSNLSTNLQSICNLIQTSNTKKSTSDFTSWKRCVKARLDTCEVSFDICEPLITCHRILHNFKSDNESSSDFWVDCARLARKCGYFQTAFNYLINAGLSRTPSLCYIKEMCKFLIKTRSEHEALGFLRKHVPSSSSGHDPILYSNLHLSMCKLMADTSDRNPFDIFQSYNKLITAGKNMEKVHYQIGKYFEKLTTESTSVSNTEQISNPELSIIHHYGTSLRYGYKYIHHSLPRLITIWLDFPSNQEKKSENIPPKNKKIDNKTSEINKKTNEICDKVRNFCKILHPFVFLCVLPQLISRICHQNSTVWEILSNLLTKLLITFPHQVSWQLIGISHSSFTHRVKRCKTIFDDASRENASVGCLLNNLSIFTSNLLEVSNRKDRAAYCKLSQAHPSLKMMITQGSLSSIMVPLLNTLTCKIPLSLNLQQHSFFSESLPLITDIDERIDILNSLIRPKKISILASDGKKYSMLCKPKDDLRRDSRLMEFNSLVNKLLGKNPQALKRNLKIRLYAVVPLNDECGIIEWVDNTVSYRTVILKLYKEINKGLPMDELKALYLGTQKNKDALLTLFTEKVIPAFPPVLQNYFYQNFPDAPSWYAARQLYMRSAAVMSIVGYILGLGDRHGENILFVNTGEVVHVDFNCLFNKGETFEWPEKVPFRLTHNMVSAMGPLGFESCFRSCCEITIEVMKARKDALLGVLSTFLHDPLVEWVKCKRNTSTLSEQANEQAIKMLADVEKRLLGITPLTGFAIPLGIPGHIHHLIQEATSLQNLSQMYYGWSSFY